MYQILFDLNTKDHPRLCGEKFYLLAILHGSRGSPPPMRGKGSLNWYGHFSCGITPAYAGKSEDLFYAEVVEEDHPRLCGEKPLRMYWS